MTTPKFTARDLANIRSTARDLVMQQIDGTYDGPEIIMTSLGYVEVWPEGDDDAIITMHESDGDASIAMHGVNYSLEQLERASKRRAAKNGSSESLTPAEHAALVRFAADHGRAWKSELLRKRANSTAFPMNHPVLYRLLNRIGPSGVKSLRLAAPNGRSRLKRTKLACARRARDTRKGSSKAASRLATHCPKRRKSVRNGSKKSYPKVYHTTYCNSGHTVATGRPVAHECYVLPPAALRAEIDGDFDKAMEIIQSKRGKMRVVKGRESKGSK